MAQRAKSVDIFVKIELDQLESLIKRYDDSKKENKWENYNYLGKLLHMNLEIEGVTNENGLRPSSMKTQLAQIMFL